MTADSVDAELMRDLMARFDFDEADLAANRNGRFSERQRESYKARGLGKTKIFCAVGLAVAGLTGLGAANDLRDSTADVLREQGLPLHPLDWKLGIGVFIGFTLVLVVGPLTLWWFLNRWPLIRGPKSITGDFWHYEHRGRYTSTPALAVGRGIRSRNFRRSVGDGPLLARMPRATLYYNQGSGKTEVHSIEPAPAER